MEFIPKLKEFVKECSQDQSVLLHPELHFFRSFISGLGSGVPETDRNEMNEWFDHFKRSAAIMCPSSGQTILEPKFLVDGTESKYRTYFTEDCFLGSGGFGSVFKCKGLLDQQVYAVKKVCIKDIAFDKAVREVRALSSLSHENIVKYFQAWVEPQLYVPNYNGEDLYEYGDICLTKEDIEAPCLYILMEYCPMSLSKLLRDMVDKNTHTRDRGFDLFRQIVSAVDFIHRYGFLHGDLSLDNVFLDENENVRVGDFGQSRKLDEEGVVMSNDYGNNFYKAPELKKGAIVDQKVDIYSLGVILGELVHPFATDAERDFVLRSLKEGFPIAWTDLRDTKLISKLISEHPAKRPTAATLMEVLSHG